MALALRLALLSLIIAPATISRAAGASSPLATGIALAEVDENDVEHPLQSRSDVYATDINSTIWIKLDQAAIISTFEPAAGKRSSPLPATTVEQRTQLIAALDALNAYLAVAGQIASQFQTFSTSAEIPGFQALVKRHGLESKDLKAKVRLYLNAKAQAPGEAHMDPADEFEKLFDGPLKVWTARLRGFLQAEIEKLDGQSSARVAAVKANSIPLKLQVSAALSRNGRRVERIHLAGYDTVKDGDYKPVDKVSFAMAEDEKKKLQTEMAFNRDLTARLNETKNLKDGLKVTLEKVFEEQAARIRQFLDESKSAAESLTRIVSETRAGVNLERPEIPPQVKSDINALPSLLRESSSAIRVFRDELAEVLPNEAKLRAIAENGDPVEALDQLVKLTGDAPDKGNAAFHRLDDKVTAIKSSMTVISSRLEQSLRSLPDDSRSELTAEMADLAAGMNRVRGVVDAFKTSSVAPLVASLKNLNGQAGKLKEAGGALALGNDLDPRLLDDKTNLRSLDDLVDTKIVLPRTSRREGDQVEVFIIARRDDGPSAESAPLAEREIILNVKKFGAFSEFSSGAAAFFGTKATKEAEFGALASFVLHRRSRTSRTWNLLNPGIGVHTAGITSGLGAGASLHLFPENFLQVGGGRTLRSGTANDWYFFVGMRLFNFKLPSATN